MLSWTDWGNPWKSPFKTVISQSNFKPDISEMQVRIVSTSGNLFSNATMNGKIPTEVYQTLPQFCKNESFPTHSWNWECEAGQLSTTKCHCMIIFQVSLVSFEITTLCTPSQANIFSYTVLQWLTWRNNALAVRDASNSGKLSTNAGNTQNSLQSQCHGENTDFLEFPSFTEKLAEDCECSHHTSTGSTHKT